MAPSKAALSRIASFAAEAGAGVEFAPPVRSVGRVTGAWASGLTSLRSTARAIGNDSVRVLHATRTQARSRLA
jgi:hypothetical protein